MQGECSSKAVKRSFTRLDIAEPKLILFKDNANECNESLLLYCECSLSYAKIMQTSVIRACSYIAECSLSYAKIMQTSVIRACSYIAECSLSYAKIVI